MPPAKPRAYRSVGTAEDWRNPFLIVCADGIEIFPGNNRAKRVTIPLTDVIAYLVKLPGSAWPYGLVVAVEENSIRATGDEERITKNREELVRLLQQAGVKLSLWPS